MHLVKFAAKSKSKLSLKRNKDAILSFAKTNCNVAV